MLPGQYSPTAHVARPSMFVHACYEVLEEQLLVVFNMHFNKNVSSPHPLVLTKFHETVCIKCQM
jgi:hypothetical protein